MNGHKVSLFLFFFLITVPLTAPAQGSSAPEDETEVLRYGLDSEIAALLGKLVGEKRFDHGNVIAGLFSDTASPALKEAVVGYFIAAEDAALLGNAKAALAPESEADPATISLFLRYLGALGAAKAAGTASLVRDCLDREGADTELWFDAAIAALGKLGGTEDGERLGALLGNGDYSSTRKQAIVRALGLLKATDAVPALSALAQDNDAGAAIRVQAVEALGDMRDGASFPVLLTLYGETNPLIRAAVVKAAANLGGADAEGMMLSAIRDDQVRVRLAAVEGIKRLGLEKAAPYLLLRAKNDPEQSVRFAAFDALAAMKSREGEEFLLGVVKEKKSADSARVRAAAALLENNKGVEAVLEATRDTLKDDKKATLALRYALGKELAKRDNAAFTDLCREFLANKDVSTQGIGLDMWAKGKYAGARSDVEAISKDEKAGVNQKKAARVLGG